MQTGARVLLCMQEAGIADVLDAIGSGVGGALARPTHARHAAGRGERCRGGDLRV